jgi:hypothetical protein
MCESDQPFVPTAVRQHAVGPYPLDPNLIAQGVPPDSRVPGAAPSGFGTSDGPAPVAVVPYNPATGSFVTPDGHRYVQSDLAVPTAPASWKDLLPC